MPSEGRRGELGFPNSHLVNSFDEVAKGLAEGTISRGRAIKLGGAALLGSMGLLSLFPHRAGAQVTTQGACTGIPAISNKRCPPEETMSGLCGACDTCFCTRTVSGRKRCLDYSSFRCPDLDQCDSDSDCPNNQVCAQVGACGCGHPRRNACIPRCPTDPTQCPP